MLKTTAIIFLLSAVIIQNNYSQCSDAGVCTIGRHQVNEMVVRKNHIYFGINFGSTGKETDINGNANDLSIASFKLEADIDLKKENK